MIYKTVEDILFEYQQKQIAYEENFFALLDKNPKYKELSKKKRELGLKLLEDSLKGKIVNETELLSLESEESEAIKDIEIKHECNKCNDTGFVNNKYCTCLLNKIYTQVLGGQKIELFNTSFETSDLSLFDDETECFGKSTQRKMYLKNENVVKSYIEKFPNCPNIIVFKGKAGLGKSFLLSCMTKELFNRGIDIMYITAPQLFKLFFEHRMGEDIPLHFIHNVDMLMIDDLGTEPPTQNVTSEYLFDMLQKREKRYTGIATNIDDIAKRYNERISSRLEDKKNLKFMFAGQDLRLHKNSKNK